MKRAAQRIGMTRRAVLLFILMLALVSYACTQTKAVVVDAQLQAAPDYEKFIQNRYNDIAKSASDVGMTTWRAGMLKEHGLTLDHVEMGFKASALNTTTDSKTLICGVLVIVGYGKTSEEMKKRVVSKRAVCHLFNGEKLENSVTVSTDPNRVLNGWDDSITI